MICIARTFGAPDSVPAGSTRRSASSAPTLVAQRADHARDDVHHVAVVLDRHEVLDLDAAVLAHAAEVVAAEVDEHHVLGALLRVGEQLLGDPPVVLGVRPARARAGDRAGRDVAAGDGDQRLGARAGDLEVAEVEEVHVRARVDGAQAAVDRERLDRDRRRPALRGHDLVGVAGVDVLDDPRDHRLELLAGHVRLERGRLPVAPPGGRAGRGTGPASRQRTSAIVSSARRVGGLEVLVGVDVGEHRDRVLEVVEHDERVGEHQREVGQAERIGVRLAERLDRAHEVVGEEPDRAAGERRQVRRAAPRGSARARRPRARTGRRDPRATSAAPCAGGSR